MARWGAALAVALAFAALVVVLFTGVLSPTRAVGAALEAELASANAPDDVVEFYDVRGDRPLWVRAAGVTKAGLRPEARQLATLVQGALQGEVPAPVRNQVLSAVAGADRGEPKALARAEVALTMALAEYARSLAPTPGAQLAFVDPELPAYAGPLEALEQAAAARSLEQHLAGVAQVNPIYHALRQGLVTYRRDWSHLPQLQVPAGGAEQARALRQRLGLPAGATEAALAGAVRRFQAAHSLGETGVADTATLVALNAGAAHYERLIEANLARARALPPPVGKRFLLVNPAAQTLTLYEGGKAKDTMRVVVGRRDDPTPMMAGLMRYAVFNPYWEVPVDLVRDSLAPKVMRLGPGYFEGSHFEALSDWGETPVTVDPRTVDWPAVAGGGVDLPVRQKPGGDNMMGQVKFMLPNELGIYLHDTPDRWAFDAPRRLLSAGCVRLENAGALTAWLYGKSAPAAGKLGANARVDLPEEVPVYISYLTAAPGPRGVVFHPDVYGRDPALLASLGDDHAPLRQAA